MLKLVEIVQWDPLIMPKSTVRPMNSSKNKLNSEIILIFHFNSNTH